MQSTPCNGKRIRKMKRKKFTSSNSISSLNNMLAPWYVEIKGPIGCLARLSACVGYQSHQESGSWYSILQFLMIGYVICYFFYLTINKFLVTSIIYITDCIVISYLPICVVDIPSFGCFALRCACVGETSAQQLSSLHSPNIVKF